MRFVLMAVLTMAYLGLSAQQQRWQQKVDYTMDIQLDVKSHKIDGKQKLLYTNHSNDTLKNVFYHLYFNAFQPGSMMDMKNQNLADPDPRMMDEDVSRISKLGKDEIGYHKIKSLTQNGKKVGHEIIETILKVDLGEPILPGATHTFEMEFESQVPVQIRRSGRDNKEGVAYTMTQWYPKMCEYDYMGWHANPYIGREFHGVWGNFKVSITLDKTYVVGGSGLVQNPNEVGHGYEAEGTTVSTKGKNITWKFFAENVHDFAWAADPDFVHEISQVPGGPTLHFLYQKEDDLKVNWKKLKDHTVRGFQYLSKNFGKYPYPQFSVIQGGDGGMEYPMCTMITGKRNFGSLVGVTMHEAVHNWYYGVLGTNEGYYAWMDEGFTSYATSFVMDHLFDKKAENPNEGSYDNYYYLVESGKEEPLSTHADRFNTNMAYEIDAYSKGCVFLTQMEYIIGRETLHKALRRYFDVWKFKHPNPIDFIREVEKESGISLRWYLDEWLNTLNTIDYSVAKVEPNSKKTSVTLEKIGSLPMPLDVWVEFKDGKQVLYHIPLNLMYGSKSSSFVKDVDFVKLPHWAWTSPKYVFSIDAKIDEIKAISIDKKKYMADIKRDNNQWEGK